MTHNAYVMKVIRTDLDLVGQGVEGDPVRRVVQFWTLEGKLLAEVDEWKDGRAEIQNKEIRLVIEKYLQDSRSNDKQWVTEMFEDLKAVMK